MKNADRALERSYWQADKRDELAELTAGDILRQAALRHPDRVALIEVVPAHTESLTGASGTNRRWSYAQLLDESLQCAKWLLNQFRVGDRVCVFAPNVPEWVVLQYGAALAGLVLVTANPALRSSELAYVLSQSKVAGILYVRSFRGTDMHAIVQEAAPASVKTFCMDSWDGVVRGFDGDASLPVVSPDDPAQIQYTSGTTGHPKGALLHHKGLVNNARFVAARAGIDGSIVLSPMPLFHTAGAVLSSLGCMATGSTFVLPLMFEPTLMMTTIQDEKCAFFFGVPTMQIAMLEHPMRKKFDLSSLKVAISGGAPVPPELLRRIEEGFGCDLLTVYGQTETSPIISQTSRSDTFDDKARTAGRPLPQVDVRIADPATGHPVAVDEEGEIEARGYQTMLGYFDMPEATRHAIRAEGWLRTGDLGRMDRRGYLRLTGRLKDMIIRGGENIYPVEIEARLMQHPGVANVAVFGRDDPEWGEIVCAAVQLREGSASASIEALRAHCRSQLAPHKIPVEWFECSSFPLTGSGKIQKFRLKEMAQSGVLLPIGIR